MEQNKESLKLDASKDFPVGKDRLYRAWTDGEELKRWWSPGDNKLLNVENDIREGGSVRYEFQGADGEKTFTISGAYQQAKPGDRLVYTWNWQMPDAPIGDGEHLLTVRFADTGQGGSRIEVTQENFGTEEAIQPHRKGWDEALESLRAYLLNEATD
jgi:uncharacterized protein YndB with AHSA1/START domain